MKRLALNGWPRHWIAALTLVGWLAGPCKAGVLGLTVALAWDGQHRAEVCENATGFSIRLRHDRVPGDVCGCPKGHVHRGLIAWLINEPNGTGSNHPDHFIYWQGGPGEAEKRLVTETKVPHDGSLAAPDLPLLTVLSVPTSIRTAGNIPCRPTHWSQAPPRAAVLLI